MPIATSPTALPRPATFVKMEDRKRPASGAVDECAPPSKRQAVNGSSKAKDDAGDMKEETWIDVYQKGAIFRQMLEYKREKTNLEVRLQELEKSTVDHDDHIRVIDQWMTQIPLSNPPSFSRTAKISSGISVTRPRPSNPRWMAYSSEWLVPVEM
ncbi:hypothetical protein B0H67DRAFT_291937 [Lasiosphaeris hirsuta]|uniref:Uncharacterized protein n=1 Tax=Lasiosphaeris hirsuta TaxID=260670 RepID=A0AA40DSA9_9PEZI|nr:hypothetical protein B0H67DRAFT_291937 [Lasiosphaeris hirsuta]